MFPNPPAVLHARKVQTCTIRQCPRKKLEMTWSEGSLRWGQTTSLGTAILRTHSAGSSASRRGSCSPISGIVGWSTEKRVVLNAWCSPCCPMGASESYLEAASRRVKEEHCWYSSGIDFLGVHRSQVTTSFAVQLCCLGGVLLCWRDRHAFLAT